MAKLLEALAISGSRKSDGTPNASGKVWVYVQGTTGLSTIYGDVEGDSVLSQPVTLDAAGRGTIYVTQVVTVHVETSAGTAVADYDVADDPGVVQVENAAFTGTLSNGSQGAGGVTDLDAILTSAATSFGGTDFTYQESAGATARTLKTWLREIHLSVKDFGAVGDGVRDDTSAIQATVNRCIALNGGVVYFPPGIYIISSAITVNTAVSVSFVGTGFTSAITNTSASGNAFTISGSNGFQMSQLYISATSSTGAAVSVARSQGFALLDLNISNHATGIDLSTGSSSNLFFQVARCFVTTTSGAGCRAVKTAGANYTSSITDSQLHSLSNADPDIELIGNVAASAFIAGLVIRGNYMFYGIKLTSVDTSSSGVVALHGNNFGNDGTSHKRITVTGTVPRISNVGNNVEGITTTMSAGGTVGPDWTDGRLVRINATGSGITIVIPAPVPVPTMRGVQLRFSCVNNNGGTTTWTFNAVYHLSGTVNGVAGNATELTVEYDLERAEWVEVARALVFL